MHINPSTFSLAGQHGVVGACVNVKEHGLQYEQVGVYQKYIYIILYVSKIILL